MPTFIFSNDYSALEKRVYMRAARVACQILQADKYDASIEIIRGNLGRTGRAAIASMGLGYYRLITDIRLEPHEVVHSLGHELIHFHQFARGDMAEQPNRIIWKGNSFQLAELDCDGMMAYLNQPWEQEAFAKQDELFKAVARELPMADREALSREYEEIRGGGLRKLIEAMFGRTIDIEVHRRSA